MRCLLLLLPASLLAAQEGDDPVRAQMRELGKSIRAIEHALGTDDATAVAAAGRQVTELAPALGSYRPAGRESESADVAWHAELVRAAAGELVDAAAAENAALQGDAFGRLRAACAACHLQFRGPGDERGFWPGQRNALFGRLRVQDATGQVRERAEHIVLFAEGLARQPAPPGRTAAIGQRNRMFHPDLLVVPVGTTVQFPNSDTVFHNIFSLSKPQPFDLELYGPGETREWTFAQAGLVKIYCNIHPEMVAHVVVLENGSATTATPSGFYCLSDLPDGGLKLRTWSEFGGEQEVPVTLAGGGAERLDLTLQETWRRLPHRNKHGRPYREKY